MRQMTTPTTRQHPCGSVAPAVSGLASRGLGTIAQRPAAKRDNSRTWYHNPQDERNFHWRDR